MANNTQPGTTHFNCHQCEDLLADAVDGLLNTTDQAAFDRHIATCTPCSQMLADAQRGAAWLEMLRTPRPEPSSALLERILMQTTGMETVEAPDPHLVPQPMPFLPVVIQPRTNVLPFRPSTWRNETWRNEAWSKWSQTSLQPRLIMTAAMAFFSIALTLNLAGIRLTELHASSLSASSLQRSFSDVRGQAVRYYDNLPVVYELESSVNDLTRTSADQNSDQNSDQDSSPNPDQPSTQPDQPTPSQPDSQSRPQSGLIQPEPAHQPANRPNNNTSTRELPNTQPATRKGGLV